MQIKTKLPYIPYNPKNDKWLNHLLVKSFNDNNLRELSANCPLEPKKERGLIYYYILKDKGLKYIGKTENSLKWRLIGRHRYRYYIKHQILSAFSKDNLQIRSRTEKKEFLNGVEKEEIEFYSKQGYELWNVEHNVRYFGKTSSA